MRKSILPKQTSSTDPSLDRASRISRISVTANAEVASHIKSMIAFYTDHIWKEDYLLFPMSKKVLTDSDQTGLQQGFAKVDIEMGDEFQSKYRHVVERLERHGLIWKPY